MHCALLLAKLVDTFAWQNHAIKATPKNHLLVYLSNGKSYEGETKDAILVTPCILLRIFDRS